MLVDDETGEIVQRALTELEQHQILDWAWGKGPKPMLFEVKMVNASLLHWCWDLTLSLPYRW